MANIVEVQFTSFQNLDSDDPLYLGQGQAPNNTFDSIEEMKAAGLSAEGIFDYIDTKHDKFSETAWERGVMLNDQYLPPPAAEGQT